MGCFHKKLNTFLTGIFAVVLAAVLTGCRMNNGDIGLLYGVWVVTGVEVDGSEYDGWRGDGYIDSFFEFQNNICFVCRTTERQDMQTQVSTWEWLTEDTEISLNFTHTDDRFPVPVPGGYTYGAPDWLLLTEPGIYVFDVRWDDDKHMAWTTVNTEGQRLTYHLKKTY